MKPLTNMELLEQTFDTLGIKYSKKRILSRPDDLEANPDIIPEWYLLKMLQKTSNPIQAILVGHGGAEIENASAIFYFDTKGRFISQP